MSDPTTTAAESPSESFGPGCATGLKITAKPCGMMATLVIAGSLAPSLPFNQNGASDGIDARLGTMDLGHGSSLALAANHRYRQFKDRLFPSFFTAAYTWEPLIPKKSGRQ